MVDRHARYRIYNYMHSGKQNLSGALRSRQFDAIVMMYRFNGALV
jgi:hypothetical protein